MRGLPLLAILISATASGALEARTQEPRQTEAEPSTGLEASVGADYEEGDYGTDQKIRKLTAPATVKVYAGRFQLAASLPYTRIEGPGNVVTGGGLLGLPIIIDPTKPAGERTSRDGIGDLTLGASYAIPASAINVTLSGEVKLPTAAKDLGTGRTDYAMAVEASRNIGNVTPFVGVGYTVPGDPDGYSLRNSLSLRAGLAARLGDHTQGYVAYSHSQSLSESLPDEQKVTSGLNTGVGKGLALGVYGTAGLSDGAPDVGAGIRLGLRIK